MPRSAPFAAMNPRVADASARPCPRPRRTGSVTIALMPLAAKVSPMWSSGLDGTSSAESTRPSWSTRSNDIAR
jgi:hypothetical protein